MKLGAKMFFCITIFFSVIFLLGGYILISFFYEISIEKEIRAVAGQYQYNKFVVQANLVTRGKEWFEGMLEGNGEVKSMVSDMEGISAFFTRPIMRLTAATQKIAGGDYEERVTEWGRDEVGQLAGNFNQMAEAVEEKVRALSENARQKEDFVANFAHELKTPLTSIIGYAERIYQKELPRTEQKKAAWHIWNEGMRLEALSLKLMDLTVLNHGNFILQEMRADTLLEELSSDVEYLMEEKGVLLQCRAKAAYVKVEYDLMKTLFLNLIDNSIKAGAKHIWTEGKVTAGEEENGAGYLIEVRDDGSGIPGEEIKKITEAFYMVDKSRSRNRHGAGIGLALAERIAQIHGGTLVFESDGRCGTRVSLRLECKGVSEDE